MSDNPCVTCLGDTRRASFPTLLIIGREYNDTGAVGTAFGTYNISVGSAFWNRSYRFVERACVLPTQLKTLCIRSNSSPILFSNALPISIPNAMRNKFKGRCAVSPGQIDAHIGSVFSACASERLRIVIMSVGQAPVFAPAKRSVAEECAKRDLQLLELPYIANQRMTNATLDAALSSQGRDSLRAIVSSFVRHAEQNTITKARQQ